ncbi:hypothetical protein T12_770 [Trichinella patagoniensis]|uniref:Uncharacterized protein n=1 Tax=Trichinella patagoniensis TaxID=990121 RepID=A0A0V0ZIX9_9BILA|nr:hypothetical protein T12_770 [Trichinella patagoniensis]
MERYVHVERKKFFFTQLCTKQISRDIEFSFLSGFSLKAYCLLKQSIDLKTIFVNPPFLSFLD